MPATTSTSSICPTACHRTAVAHQARHSAVLDVAATLAAAVPARPSTALPFAATAIFRAIMGTAMAAYAPGARSLGEVLHSALQAAPHGSAGARSRRPRPTVQVVVSTDTARHQAQDLQSLALNEAAVAFIQSDPALVRQAQEVLERWMASGPMRSRMLWAEWQSILRDRQWRKVLGRTRRAQELRQTSPIVTVLPDAVRQQVLAQVRALGSGVALGDTVPMTGP